MSDQRLSALLFLLASPVLSQEAVRGRFDPQGMGKVRFGMVEIAHGSHFFAFGIAMMMKHYQVSPLEVH